jgi:RES domain-containing protein
LRPVKAHAAPYETTLYRCVETTFAHDFVSGKGAQLHGGRWNPKGAFPAVYLCDSPETALAEYLARSRRMRLPDARVLPMVMAAVETRVSLALDLDAPQAAAVVQPFLTSEKVHWRTIQHRREAVSQAIGRALHRLGLHALVVTSQARSNGHTIVLFPDRFSSKDRLSAPSLKILPGNIS